MKVFSKIISMYSKDKIKPLLNGITILTWIGLAAFFTLNYPFSFNYETYNIGQYKLFFVIPFLSIVLTGLLFKKNFELNVLNIAAILAIYIFLLLFSFSEYYSWGNEHFSFIGVILFISIGILLIDNIIYIKTTVIFFLLLFFYEIYSGVIQWIDTDRNMGNVSLAITGTLQNSGIYACYLVINLPLLYWLLYSTYSIKKLVINSKIYNAIIYWAKRVLFFFILLLCCTLIFKTQSRTAFFAMIALVISGLIINWGKSLWHTTKKVPKAILFYAVIIAISTLFYVSYYLFNLRKLSSMGRLMRADITLQHINDSFWFGTGLGRFTWYFPQWQATYFATHPNPPKSYFMSAGESYLVFNEYLQLFKEIGFVGFVLFIILLFCFYKTKSESNSLLLNMLKATVTIILVCGFTSYPFHVNIFLLTIAFCFGAIIKFGENDSFLLKKMYLKNSIIFRGNIAILLILSFFLSYQSYYQYRAANKLDDLRNSYNSSISSYDSLYHVLKNDGKFLAEYSIALNNISANHRKATRTLQEGKQYFISQATIYALAKAYEKEGDYPKAINNFQLLSNYLPNNFQPKYELLKVYQKIGDTISVRQLAKSILTIPVKFNSFEIDDIKFKVSNIQHAYNSH